MLDIGGKLAWYGKLTMF